MRSFIIGLAVFFSCLGTNLDNVAHAQDFVLLDSDQITEKFETSLSVAKELLDARSPPKYLLYKAEATIAKTNGLDGKIAGKIPALLVSAEIAVDYYNVTTTTEQLVYLPATSIPTNFDDLGVGEFVTRIQDKFEDDLASGSAFVVARASLEHSFLIKVEGTGKLTFLSVVSVEGEIEVKNVHTIVFHFCLVGNDGECIEG